MKKISVRDFEPKTLIKGVHLTQILKKKNCSKNISWRRVYIYIYIVNLKKQKKSICHWLLFIPYSIWVHVESPKYIMICLKSPKSSEFDIVLANSGQISLTMFISSCVINYSIDFLKIGKFKKGYASDGIRTHNTWFWGPRNTCAIGCAKKYSK